MKISKELKTGIIAILAIGLLVTGVNFLKGNSFFGGDDVYTAYFHNSAGVTPATSVYANGVIVGKVLTVDWQDTKDSTRRVKMTFNIQEEHFKIPKNARIKAGSASFFDKGLLVEFAYDEPKGYYQPGDEIMGYVEVDLTNQVKEYAEPLVQKVQLALGSIDKMVNSLSAFWDTTANSEIQGTLKELQGAIHKLGNVATEVELLVTEEKVKLSHILSNVEGITSNLEKSNEQISSILGNAKQITDDLVTADFKAVIGDAQSTLQKFNTLLEDANNGNGSLGKLLKDEQLYNELNATNQRMQSLVQDIQLHPERYIHFSVFGAKSKVQFTPEEEKKLREKLESNP